MPKTEPFETHVEQYDAWFEKHRYAYESELQAIRMLLPRQGRGVEIGVGTGRFAAPLGVAVGVEPAQPMRALAQRRGITVVEGVAEALPFEEASFDYALMVTTVCFLDNVDAAFREVYRVLKPGGAFVVGLIDRQSPLGQAYEQHKQENVFYRAARFHAAVEVETFLQRAGFRRLMACQTIFGDPTRMKQPDPVKDGYGEGGFVVLRGERPGADVTVE